jgi:hypothetical protein
MTDILQRAAQTGEPINIISLGRYVKVPIPGGPVSALTYWIPALDVVPAIVTAYDPANPAASTFKVISAAAATRGLYRGVLIDHKAARALCTTSPSGDGNCVDQPVFSGTLP